MTLRLSDLIQKFSLDPERTLGSLRRPDFQSATQLPWYLLLTYAGAAWICGLLAAIAAFASISEFLNLGFFSSWDREMGAAHLMVGVVFLGVGLPGYRRNTGPFSHNFFMSLILAGFGLSVFGLTIVIDPVELDIERTATAVAGALAFLLLFMARGTVIQFTTFLVGAVLLAVVIESELTPPFAAMVSLLIPLGVMLWVTPSRIHLRPLGLICMFYWPVLAQIERFAFPDTGKLAFTSDLERLFHSGMVYLPDIVITLSLWGVGALILRQWQRAPSPAVVAVFLTATAALPLLISAGQGLALLLYLLAYLLADWLLFGLATVTLGYFIIEWYYHLPVTLLTKSLLMLGASAVFLAVWFWLLSMARRGAPPNEGPATEGAGG